MGRKAAEMAERRLASQINVDDAQAMYYRSLAAKAAQDAGSGAPGDGVEVYPYGTQRGTELIKRPLVVMPRTSRPMRTEVIADDGYRYKIIDPDTGDELSQMDLFQQMVLRHTKKARKAPGRELRIQLMRWARKAKQAYKRGLKSTRERRQR